MRSDEYDDLRDTTTGNAENASKAAPEQPERPASGEVVILGRDAHDSSRTGVTHGRDVLSEGEQPGVETHGRTVIDHTHRSEARGVDVIDLGPSAPEVDEPQER